MEDINGVSIEEKEFSDTDYDLQSGNEDYQQFMDEQRKNKGDIPWDTPSFSQGVVEGVVEKDCESDDENSEELFTDPESDGDDKPRAVEFNEEKELYNPSLKVGMLFRDFEQLKKACRNWGIKNRFQVWFPQNDKKRVICACHYKQCSFRIYAARMSKDNPSVQIKNANFDHTCGKVFTNFHVTSRWLAVKYLDKFRADPIWIYNGIIKQVKDDHGFTISIMKAWRTKNLAMKWVNGDEAEQYTKLIRYVAELRQSNPVTTVILWRDEGCRPFIGLDGCFLKGLYDGQVLSAVGIDLNDCIFPIAYAVVLIENRESWTWFMEALRDDLEIWNSKYVTIMSDRQKGLKRAVEEVFPDAEHRNCVRHIYTNFGEKFRGKALKDFLWNAARAMYVQRFNYWLGVIEKENPNARKWLDHQDKPYASWTRALFSTSSKCDILLNNICECFNRYILDARDKGIITMLEMIKVKLKRRMKKKKEQMLKYKGNICPKIQKKLDKMKEESQYYTPDFSGLPCSHGISAIYGNNQQLEEFLHASYLVSTYMRVYEHYINPTNNEELWPEVNDGTRVIPPPIGRRQKGRKAKARRKEPEEIENSLKEATSNSITSRKGKQKLARKGLSTVRCTICHVEGHNKRHHEKRRRSIESTALVNMSSGSIAATNESSQHQDILGTQQYQTRQPSDITRQGPALSVNISMSSNVHVGNLGNVTYCIRLPKYPPANRVSSEDKGASSPDKGTKELDCFHGRLI
ncbi:uncharacterized protein LOC120269103 [Dioscorea cayenensis subsp. rotundata]|uniref:Uncharacterized protein LOC120269103 n=1 Tax=Dioscorea cayennensis subsp. rotundata TaxID=55577 RepID=A0AB40BXU4_DIOCR|nr:uncharacterized protein LOC120269103 [Dioscorea cayenensis subsp. rotundata]